MMIRRIHANISTQMFPLLLLLLVLLFHQTKAIGFDDGDRMAVERADAAIEKAEDLALAQQEEVRRSKREGDEDELDKMMAEEESKPDEGGGGGGGSETPKEGSEGGGQKADESEEDMEKAMTDEAAQNDKDESDMEKAFDEEASKSEGGGEGGGGEPGKETSGGGGESKELDRMIAEEGAKRLEGGESNPSAEGGGGGGGGGSEGGGEGEAELEKEMAEDEKTDGGEDRSSSSSNEDEVDEEAKLEKLIAKQRAELAEQRAELAEQRAKLAEQRAELAKARKTNEFKEAGDDSAVVKKTLAEYIHELEVNKQLADTDKAVERKVRTEDGGQSDEELAAAIEEVEAMINGWEAGGGESVGSGVNGGRPSAVTDGNTKVESFDDVRLLKFAIFYSLIVELILATVLVVTYRRKLCQRCKTNDYGTETEPLYRQQFHVDGLETGKPWRSTSVKEKSGRLDRIAFGASHD